MKNCELCMMPAATTYCESDQARLCWDCDAKVHGANFLVARHVRCLLCHLCQSQTPWRASGFKLGHTAASICEMCVNGGDRDESQAENEDYEEEESDSSDEVEEEADKKVVSYSWCSVSNTHPPATTSSSSTEDSSGGISKSEILFTLKRLRANASEIDRLSAKRRYNDPIHSATTSRLEEEVNSVGSIRLSQNERTKPERKVQ